MSMNGIIDSKAMFDDDDQEMKEYYIQIFFVYKWCKYSYVYVL